MAISSRRLKRSENVPVVPPSGPLLIQNVSQVSSTGTATVQWETTIPADSQSAMYFAPAKHCSWNWQLSGTLDTTADAQVYDFDAFDNGTSEVSTLHSQNRYCIAYFSAGSWENWRPDKDNFPSSVLGNNLDGWAGEKWLDVRQLDILRPLMAARADIAKAKGFDAIEWDNVDGYQNNPGFPMTSTHQAAYNKMLAQITHERGMACFLKNATDLVNTLEPFFDGAIVEEAYRYNEADSYIAFPNANKPALLCEYQDLILSKQNDANSKGFSVIRHRLNLDTAYIVSYVTNPPVAVALTDTQSPKLSSTMTMSHSMTFTGLTPGQSYGYLVWSEANGERVYDETPRQFVAS